MSEPARKLATWEDLWKLPEGVRAEILGGQIEVMPSPTVEHQEVGGELFTWLRERFRHRRRGPGGWWIVLDVDVEFALHEVVRPDVAGWRRDRVPEMPLRPVRHVPDWVLEVVSDAKRDRVTKMATYHKYGVPYYWLIDPVARVLEAYALGDLVVRLGAWTDETEARIPPFDAVPLDVAELFATLDPPV